jgi:hypothetical protein
MMSDSDAQSKELSASLNRARTAVFLTMLLCIAVLLCVRKLIEGPFPFGNELIWTYAIYTVASVALLHTVFFAEIFSRKAKGKAALSSKVPKALEYFYTAIIAMSLGQIVFAAPKLADFIRVKYGEERQLLSEIRDQARTYIAGECQSRTAESFTPAYCESMAQIVKADDLSAFIIQSVEQEAEFLFHYVGPAGSMPPKQPGFHPSKPERTGKGVGFHAASRPPVQQRPFLDRALQFDALAHYASAPVNERTMNWLSWFGLLFLPIGIALRLVKTSLELFGGLK